MLLYLADLMARTNTEPALFFRLAYIWKFEREVDVSKDVRAYLNDPHCVPKYVEDFVHHIQQEEKR